MSESHDEREPLELMRDAAVARIFDKFPELESTNVELLRMLLGYAWLDGYREYASEKARAIEAELILRGAEL
jgi:hypothetical protein